MSNFVKKHIIQLIIRVLDPNHITYKVFVEKNAQKFKYDVLKMIIECSTFRILLVILRVSTKKQYDSLFILQRAIYHGIFIDFFFWGSHRIKFLLGQFIYSEFKLIRKYLVRNFARTSPPNRRICSFFFLLSLKTILQGLQNKEIRQTRISYYKNPCSGQSIFSNNCDIRKVENSALKRQKLWRLAEWNSLNEIKDILKFEKKKQTDWIYIEDLNN